MKRFKVGQAELGVLARLLRGVEFFSPLTVGQLDQILPYVLLQAYEAGEAVFKQNDPGDAFYIVYQGRVEVRVKGGFLSFSKRAAELGEGEFFGEIALLESGPRTAAVACLEPTKLFVLVASDFQFTLKSNPALAGEMAKIAARRQFHSKHLPQ